MPCVSLHGVRIAWSCEDLAFDPMREVLSAFPPVELSGGQRPDIEFRLRSATTATAADPLREGLTPSFFHGIMQAYRAHTAFVLFDRASRVRLPLDGSPILAEIAPPCGEIAHGSAPVMLHIAVTLSLRRLGLYHLHAAGLIHPGGAGVLIAGGSGAGKTTTTLALIEAGFDYLGDDSLFVRERAGDLEILSSPREFHLGQATLGAFPQLAPLAVKHRWVKDRWALDPRRAFPGRDRSCMPAPEVLILPRVVPGGRTELAKVCQADALGHLIASSATLIIEGLPGRGDNLGLLKTLVHSAHIASLSLAEDMLAAPSATVASLLPELLGSALSRLA